MKRERKKERKTDGRTCFSETAYASGYGHGHGKERIGCILSSSKKEDNIPSKKHYLPTLHFDFT